MVLLSGELDLAGRDQLAEVLRDAVHGARLVEVNLDQVRFIDSTILSALLLAHQNAVEAGHRLIVTHASGHVRRVLDMTGVMSVLGDEPG
ncbi:STAS domain-containing protein [Micromonospora sp. BQ11]|uniref:STAS domain-containing protein n=1 Tax=Micromonospora sp. BQ11 TaxID=3452212 RepID=UPI003F8B13A5